MTLPVPPVRRLILAVALTLTLSGCADSAKQREDPAQVDAVETPELGACRVLAPDDVELASNATRTVDCTDSHTAETYAVGPLPDTFKDASHDDEGLAAFAYNRCAKQFEKFLGADESLVMRTVVSWAWFRPTEKAWDEGARWYRCDAVGGGEQSKEFVDLPESAKGLLAGRTNDKWMVCADGPTVVGDVKVPCSEQHTWRAVTTIKVGTDTDPYPGDRLVEVKTRDFCSKSVAAWMNYPVDYDYAYTWFHEAEWKAGNRRSICWARTEQ